MGTKVRIDPTEAKQKIREEGALLVCAYEDEEKCERLSLEGSIDWPTFQQRRADLPEDKDVVFYCT